MLSCAAVAVVTFLGWKSHLNAATVELFYLLIVALQSRAGSFLVSFLISVTATLALDYFFFPPVLTFRIAYPIDGFTLATFLVIAIINTQLVTRAEEALKVARRRQKELERIYEVARELLALEPTSIIPLKTVGIFRKVFGLRAACIFDGSTAEAHTDGQSAHDLTRQTRQAYFLNQESDNRLTAISLRQLRISGKITGMLGLEGLAEPEFVAGPLTVLANATLERSQALENAARAAAAAQAEVFRTAILDALAHEFKTPLATILTLIGARC